MVYASGTRTLQSNSAEDLYTQIATQMTAHGNYTFIEDFTTGTNKWSVWRCGALNSTGIAFYVLFNRTTTASTTLNFGICEDYDTGTHSVIRAAPPGATGARTPAADGSVQGATGTVLPNAASVALFLGTRPLVVDPSSYDYWIAVNNDGMWVGCRVGVAAAQGIVLGTFDSLVDNPATNDPRPLFLGGDASTPPTVCTRHPLVTTSQGYLWGGMEWYTATYRWPTQAISGTVGGATNDLFQAQKAVGARMVMRTWASTSGSIAINLVGFNRGLFRHILSFAVAAGVTVGDTITLGATTWTYTGKGVFYETSAA